MTLRERIKCWFCGPVPRHIDFEESRGMLYLTVHGRPKDQVALRLLDSSDRPLQWNDGTLYLSGPLTFEIPHHRNSVEFRMTKPDAGEYTLEVKTPGGISHCKYLVA